MSAPSFFEVFARYLKEAREHKGLSQAALGLKADVPQSTISALELAGGGEERKVKRGLRAEHIDALLEALDVSVFAVCKRMSKLAEEMEHEQMNARAAATLPAEPVSDRERFRQARASGQLPRLEEEVREGRASRSGEPAKPQKPRKQPPSHKPGASSK